MAAFSRVVSRNAVSGFCAVGAELLNGPVCLLAAKWEETLDAIENATSDHSLLPPVSSLPIGAATAAVRHYNEIYTRCTELIVVPLERWKQWHDGLSFLMSQSTKEPTGALFRFCRQLLLLQQERFAVVFWGCWSSVAVRLESLASQLSSSASFQEDYNKTVDDCTDDGSVSIDEEVDEVNGSVDQSILCLKKRYFFALYSFQRLAHDAAHIFSCYPLVGKAERQWFSDKLLLSQDERAAEALIRRSFKRDLGVPSTELESGALIEEYDSFEVNDDKARVMRKRAEDTLAGAWHLQSRELLAFEVIQQEASFEGFAGDSRGGELLDKLVDCLHMKAGRPDLALALTMQRILEKEPFPATFDGERLEFALGLFLQWFKVYVGGRRSNDIPLFSSADLWNFVLERHTELLKWAVFYYCSDGSKADLTCGLESVKMVCFSVQRCLEIYVSNGFSKRLSVDAKKHLKHEANSKVYDWFINTVLKLFFAGIQRLSSECVETAVENTTSFFLPALFATRIVVVKSQLMLLYDASLLAMDVRRELLSIIEPSFEHMNALVSEHGDTPRMSNWTMCMLGVLSTLRRTIGCSTDSDTEVSEHFVAALHSHYRALHSLSPLFMADLVSDAWIDFLLTDGRHAFGSRRLALIDLSCAWRSGANNRFKYASGRSLCVDDTRRKRSRGE